MLTIICAKCKAKIIKYKKIGMGKEREKVMEKLRYLVY